MTEMDNTPVPCLLDDAHCKTLDDCMRACSQTQDVLERAKRAGLDMSAADEHNRQTAQLAAGLKKEFFPGRP